MGYKQSTVRLTNARDIIQISYQVLAATTLIAAATIGYHQLTANQSTKRAQAVVSLLDDWDSAEQRQARQYVTSLDFAKLNAISDLAPEDRARVDLVLTTLNHIAYAALNGIVPTQDVNELFGPGMVRIWDRAAPLVQRTRDRGDTRFLSHLERYVNKYRPVIPASRPKQG